MKKLDGWQPLKPAIRERRLRQGLESLTIAIAWAEQSAADAGTAQADSLAKAVSGMRQAEELLKRLIVDAEREAPGWEPRVPEVRTLLVTVLDTYDVGTVSTPGSTSPRMATLPHWLPPELETARVAIDVEDALVTFQAAVDHMGLRDGLAYLLGLTRYRHAGLWKYVNGEQKALAYFDRQDPMAYVPHGAADRCGGCVHVRTRAGIRTLDELLSGHPVPGGRRLRRTYRSVPIVGPAGEVLATLCLYDSVARQPTPGEVELLERCSTFLAQNRTFSLARCTDDA